VWSVILYSTGGLWDKTKLNAAIYHNLYHVQDLMNLSFFFLFLKVEAHGEVVNAVNNKRFSSFALYGKESDYVVPHQVSSINHPRDMDKKQSL